jgi:hypothetical protein
MTEPERLFHESESELARAMLGAAREEAPDERLLQRTLLAVGTGAAVIGAAGAAGGVGAGTSSLSALAAKWFGIGAIGGIVTMGAAVGVEQAFSSKVDAVEKPVAVVAPVPVEVPATPRTPTEEPTAVPEPPPTAKLGATPPPSAARPETKEGEPSIGAELVAIDNARAALAAGDNARALSLVSVYERQPGQKRMSQEALAIRMEAQARSGDAAGARASAERLLAIFPNGPQAARARQIIGR